MKEDREYMPACNGKENGAFPENFQLEDEADSDDSKDSDVKQLFELPKRQLVRPISSTLRRKLQAQNKCWATTKDCCKLFITVTLPMLIAIFIVTTILCLTFLLVGIAGMKREISILKIRLKNVDAAEENFLGKKEQLRKTFQRKLSDLVNHENQLNKFDGAVKLLMSRLDVLNSTVYRLHDGPSTKMASKLLSVKHDIDTLKTGMADTGADIERLTANGKKMKQDLHTLTHQVANGRQKMYNMSVQISLIQNKPTPSFKTTQKTLIVTLTPDEDLPVKMKELKVILQDFGKKQAKTCKQEMTQYDVKLERLWNKTMHMNESYFNEISHLQRYLAAMKTSKLSTTVKPGISITGSNNTQLATPSSEAVMPVSKAAMKAQVLTTAATMTDKSNTSSTNPTKTIPEASSNTTYNLPVSSPHNATNSTPEQKKKGKGSSHLLAKVKRGYNDLKADDILENYERNNKHPHRTKISVLKPLRRKYLNRGMNPDRKDGSSTSR